jgi:hypothetical protein
MISGQNLSFKLTGKVELRNWSLSSRAMKSGTIIPKATIELQNASGVISHSESDNEGNFVFNFPSNGEFTLTISTPGQNPKKYLVITKGTPSIANDPNFKPTINISGFISEKHKKDMNYIGLFQPQVKIENSNIIPRSTINDGEYLLIQKFCTANKLGDMALEKKNYELAKTFYSMAIDMIGAEPYPKDQLKKAEDGLKMEKTLAKKQKRYKQGKVKSAMTKQKAGPAPSHVTGTKTTVETGKPARKIPKVLGK